MSAGFAYTGKLYRALNPLWAQQPLSGSGAAAYGGRFNCRGMAALYCSLNPLTALREANQVGDLQPTTLVAFDAVIERVFDTRDPEALARHRMTSEDLASADWRDEMRTLGACATQRLADELIAAGHHGLLVRSFARGAGAEDLNLVLWRWSDGPPSRLNLIDDEGRLAR